MVSGAHDLTARTRVLAIVDRGHDTTPPPLGPSGRLICVVGTDVGRVVRVGAQPVLLGRGVDAAAPLDHPEISRRHARIEWRDDHFAVVDLGSRNGTWVNGVRVGESALRPGDRLQLGSCTIFLFAHHDELEERALRLQTLENLAQLAGGLVHDFKNTLGIIGGNAELLGEQVREQLGDRHEWLHGLGAIQDAAAAGLELAQRLLLFARRKEASGWSEIEVAGLADEVTELVRRPLRSRGVEMTLDVPRELSVRGHREELRHALLNLVLNGRDAMPGGGQLSIVAARRSFSSGEALAHHIPCAGAYVDIAITDTGAGMDEAALARAFEPFFTTKPAGEGTGLGLSTVYGIVRNHGGHASIESVTGQGTKVRLLLPLTPGDLEL